MRFNDINLQVSGPQQPASTYKTKVLKGQVPFAVQVTEPNTKYVIKHNFVLNGDVTIPENCILEFDGGSISGEHTITGANTGIEAGLVKVFSTDVTLTGSWNVAEAYPEWFGAKGDDITDDTEAIQKTIDFSVLGYKHRIEIIITRRYAVSTISIIYKSVHIRGNLGVLASDCGFSGIRENSPVILFSGVSQGSILEDFTIIAKENGIIGIYSNALRGEGNTAGLWYSEIKNIGFRNCDTAIKLEARDDIQENEGYDVANQYIIINNIKTWGTKNIDIHIIGQLGQNSFKDCYFEVSAERNYYIYVDTPSTSASDGCYLCMEDCSFVGNPLGTLLYNKGLQYSEFIFDNCWFEGITSPFVTSKTQSSMIFQNCLFNNCNGNVFASECASQNRINIYGGVCFGSVIANAYDSATMNNVSCNLTCNNGLITNFFRGDTRILRAGEAIETLVDGVSETIVDPIPLKDCSLKVNLRKHGSYSHNIVGIKQGDTLIGYFRLEQLLDLRKHDGDWFISNRQIPLHGTTSERVAVIDNSLIQYGFPFFDDTIKKPIWWGKKLNGANEWIEADGAAAGVKRSGTNEQIPPGWTELYNGFCYFNTTYGLPSWAKYDANNVITWIAADGAQINASRSGTYEARPTVFNYSIPIGFAYFCTNRQTPEGQTDGIMIYYKGNEVWVDALGRVVS